MTDVFISYARPDRPRVERLATALEGSGFRIWWDTHIEGGTEFARELEARLDEAAIVLVCWSRASVDSMWVADEATVGRDKGNLVPIAIDAVPPKLGFRQIHAIDFSAWSGEPSAPEYRQLERTLRARLAAPAAAAPPAATLAPSVGAQGTGGASRSSRTARRGLLAALAVAVVGALAALVARAPGEPPQAKSLAVLPFDARPAGTDGAEYGEWLAELISGQLGKANGLLVTSQSSASAFRDGRVALPEVARKLGVALILKGSVRSAGGDIVISAHLIDARTERQVWADVYQRRNDNGLVVQSEVAARVAAAVAASLGVTIAGAEQQALSAATDPQTLADYREALTLYRTTLDGSVRRAQRLLEATVERDPGSALAWALLSRVHAYFFFNGSDATEGRRAAAERARDEALRLRPDLVEVLLADAYVAYWVGRDYEGARTRFAALSDRWPNNADVLTALASITRRQGRWDESRQYFERAVAIDPLRPGRRAKAAELQLATRDFTGALRLLDASLQYWPDPPDSIPFVVRKAQVYQALGRLDEADRLLDGLDVPVDGELVQPVVYQALLRRRPERAIGIVADLLRRDEASGSEGRNSIEFNLYLGDLRQGAGDAARARGHYLAAAEELRAELARQPGNPDIHSYLALAYRGLGDRARAIEHARIAVTAVPLSRDALSGAWYLDLQARVLARVGERDAAIAAIETLTTIPAPMPLTPALLRLDPDFDGLRAEPRFRALLD